MIDMGAPVILGSGTVIPMKDAVHQAIQEVFVALSRVGDSIAKTAMLCLVNHMSANWRAIYLLEPYQEKNERALLSHSLAILTRSMFDAYLQLAYIAEEDTEGRASLYVSFEAIERYQREQKVVTQDDDISKTVAASPLRADGEKVLEARYKEVVGGYTTKKGAVRSQWYPHGNLGNLANELGRYDEYLWFTQRFNSAVHAGPLAAMIGHPNDNFIFYAGVLMSRAAKLVVQQHGINLDVDAQSTIDHLAVPSLTTIDPDD